MPWYFPVHKMVQGGVYVPAGDPAEAIAAQTLPLGPQPPLTLQVVLAFE
jgi:hypothetical protein